MRDEAIKNQVKQIHIHQECIVLMCRYKMWKRSTKRSIFSKHNGMYLPFENV